MELQTTNIISQEKKPTIWDSVPKYWSIIISLLVGLGFLITTWFQIKANAEATEILKAEVKNLEERITRQYANQKADIDKVIKEFEPVKNWVEWKKGYDQATKELKK